MSITIFEIPSLINVSKYLSTDYVPTQNIDYPFPP